MIADEGGFRDFYLEAFYTASIPHAAIPPLIEKALRKRLQLLDAAVSTRDLANLKGNRFHMLTGSFAGEASISVNDQYRLHFQWDAATGTATNVYLHDHNYKSRR